MTRTVAHCRTLLTVSLRVAAVAACVVALSGCKDGSTLFRKNINTIDPQKELQRDDYSGMLDAANDPNVTFKTKGQDGGPPIPDLAPILAAPQPPKLGETKLVSIAVTDDIPLKDVLLELARLADVDMEIDASIAGGVSFRAKDRPFNEVIERVSDLAGLRYKMVGGVLRVERDTPYVEIYPIDFINIERTSNSSVNVSTNVLSSSTLSGSSGGGGSSSGGGGGGSSGLNTGSQSSITSKSDSDFWKQFEEGVKQILQFKPATMMSLVTSAPQPRAAAPVAQPGAPAAAPAAPSAAAANASTDKTFYILNRQGATLTVSGTDRQHALLKEFINKMKASSSAQVLIEAKIVEVTLNQGFESGIDWNKLGGSKVNFVTNFGGLNSANFATFTAKANDLTSLNIDLDTAIRLTENFGTTRTLSSPRLNAINNQQAVLTFAQNQVYFQVRVERQTVTSTVSNDTLTVNSDIKTVPIGIIMLLQPSINLDTNEVTLNVRPTLSRVTGFVSDPAVAYLVAEAQAGGATLNVDSRVPVVEVRELDSILRLKSGQVMVIGGLMEDSSLNEDTGIPGAQEIPLVGNLFKKQDRANSTKELVIFIRATIIDSSGNVSDADKGLYKKFINDPRPMNF